MQGFWSSVPSWHGADNAVTLRMGVTHIRRGVPYVRELLKLSVRAHWQRSLTRRWLGILNSHPFLGRLACTAPHLLHKVYRPYLTNTLCPERRLAALEQHYRFVIEYGLDAVVLEAAREGSLLACFEGKCGTPYEIWLRAVAPLEREGELVLQLRTGGALVYSLAFSFSGSIGKHVVFVGCIQGPKSDVAPELIRACTRSLHGLRPKNLLIGLVRQIGHDLGCTHAHLVGNTNRVVHGALRQGKVLADYDQAWAELGAVRRPDGDFELECRDLPPPALEEVESKRRSELRKRHALCSTVHSAVGERLLRPGKQLS
ncbi:DUF535 family protein [Massilia cavernae]|uniref:DUF535 domain-containing protein n=1 Tax=Massilia cavernae TaxID=2320864 RepID=A0A418XQW8_9BURK|nr:DUF535 family protein [Massilia cavernae]RJG14879.1 DUF535 domain-containing protein [Massilia cavernae]